MKDWRGEGVCTARGHICCSLNLATKVSQIKIMKMGQTGFSNVLMWALHGNREGSASYLKVCFPRQMTGDLLYLIL